MLKRLNFSVPFEGAPSEAPDSSLFVFDRAGALLASSAIKQGAAAIDIAADASPARVFVGPTPDAEDKVPVTPEKLERIGAYEPIFSLPPGAKEFKIPSISKEIIARFRQCRCRVVGRVVKNTRFEGTMQDLPVCHARVHIEEVDPLRIWLKKVPDKDVFKLRSQLLDELVHWPPGPIPGPGPIERPIDAVIARPMMMMERTAAFSPLPVETRAHLASDSINVVRSALFDNSRLLYPYLCGPSWAWLRPHLVAREIAVVETDDQGRFDITIFHPCWDQPDLYFWVEYGIGGAMVPVYRRPIACDTHWNYKCGTEIVIRITDARVPACQPAAKAGLEIDVYHIGDTGFLHRLRPEHLAGTSIVDRDRGLLAWNPAAGEHTAEAPGDTPVPMGGTLYVYADFSAGLRDLTVATHYLWSIRHVPEVPVAGDTTTDWQPITGDITRDYIVRTGLISEVRSYPLKDPTAPGTYFKIQPNAVPASLVPAGATAEWTVNASRGPSTQALVALNTTGLGMFDDNGPILGLYEVKLELFKQESSGAMTRVDLTTANVAVRVWGKIPTGANLVDAPEDNLRRDAGTDVTAFRMLLRIDNNPVNAEIADARVPAFAGHTGIADTCGFVDYQASGSTVTLGFRAWHLNHWLRYSFRVNRGSAGTVVSADGREGQASGAFTHPLSLPFGSMSADFTLPPQPLAPGADPGPLMRATTLGAACHDGRAAFAETLVVTPMATDGTYTLPSVWAMTKAFALNPV